VRTFLTALILLSVSSLLPRTASRAQGPSLEAPSFPAPATSAPTRTPDLRFESDGFDEALPTLEALGEQALRRAREALGPVRGSLTVRIARGTPSAVQDGETLSLVSDRVPSANAFDPEGRALLRGIAGLWATSDAPWIEAGIRRYAETWLRWELEDASTEVGIREITLLYQTYREGRERRIADGDGQSEHGEAGAALAMMCADLDLRAHGTGLFAALRDARGEDGVAEEDLFVAIEAIDPAAAHGLRERVGFRGVIDLGECLRPAGLRLASDTHRAFTDETLRRLLGITEWRDWPPTVVASEGRLQPGDRIRYVRGRRLERLSDLPWILGDMPAYREFPVAIDRGGESVVEVFAMVGVPRRNGIVQRFRILETSEGVNDTFPFFRAALPE